MKVRASTGKNYFPTQNGLNASKINTDRKINGDSTLTSPNKKPVITRPSITASAKKKHQEDVQRLLASRGINLEHHGYLIQAAAQANSPSKKQFDSVGPRNQTTTIASSSTVRRQMMAS